MLQIQKIKKEYIIGNLHQTALNGITLNLRDNEFVAILGPSGSGKTTLLNIIGGLDHYDSGDLIINGISTKKYKDRDWDSYRNHTIGFVFQSYNLIPHQTVLANVELALTISGISKSERRKRAIDALKQVGLEKHVYKRPNQMSGGQMQRVAIARALVNDPDILLADEPTGALDSDTSVQVMELLKKVAKDRLVVMVTHNPELAQKYANRIVKVRDGNIVDDTNPFKINVSNQSFAEHKNMGKASMSWLTSLSLSFNNLKTKKARTILTSFAGSIGIIGIALILSLSNGVNQYIQSIEEETLSEYPLQIQSTGFDITSIMTDVHSNQDKDEKDDTKIYVSQMITNMFSKIGSNDLTSLKDYLDSGKSDIKKYTNAIEYNYNIAPQIYTINSENIRQVNPDKSFSSLGLGSSTNSNSLISSMMSTDVFYPMPSNLDLYKDQYDIKAGNWPKSYNECVVVLSKNGNINDFMLYTLGLRDYSELDKMIEQFSKEESVEIPDNSTSYSYKDILGIEFKLVNAADYYQYDSNYNVYKDKKDDQNYMKNLIENGEDIKIVGIVQPKDSATATMLQSGIGYPAALTTHVIKQAASSEIIKKQLDNPNIDVFTGKDFNDKNKNQLDLNSLFTVDEEILKSAFTFDQSKLSMEDLDLSQIKLDSSILPTIDVNDIFSDMKINISQDNIESFTKAIITQFQEYLKENELIDPTKINEYFRAFLQTEQVQKLFQDEMVKIIQTSGLTEQFENQLQIVMAQYTDTISKSLQQ
nr:ABC transporter ATP-binding protein [Thomasclavelia cocleata]